VSSPTRQIGEAEAFAPCPLCNGEARLGLTNHADERSGYVKTFTAYCTECGCQVARSSKTDKNGWANEGDESVKRRVREAWNKRALIPASDLEQITRDLNEAVRLLRRWHTVDYPSEALEDITDAFLSRLATTPKP